jgi:hypothetical protein
VKEVVEPQALYCQLKPKQLDDAVNLGDVTKSAALPKSAVTEDSARSVAKSVTESDAFSAWHVTPKAEPVVAVDATSAKPEPFVALDVAPASSRCRCH